jgi:hypothetical protein
MTCCCVLAVFASACYTQRPLDTAVPAPATRIVADLTDSGTAALGDLIGPGALEMEAVVAQTSVDAWSLQLLRVEHRDGRSIAWNRELVQVPRSALDHVMERRLDRTKSWIAAGAVVTGAFIVARMFQLIGAEESAGGEPTPQEVMVPAGAARR